MSGSAAKFDRRQMRRVLGEDGVTLLEALIERTGKAQQLAFETANAQVQQRKDLSLEMSQKTAVLRRDTLGGRLRWLFTGK